ncbi:MAG: sulfotransferase domain-containing protein [Geodermatophilaceae bacterium]|nr:sulfotransferase domain-containing protein [Geodermatophilaceae bacterium]
MSTGSSATPRFKRGVHVASRAVGRLTARHRMLPAFLIVGAQRSGTTSMYRTLNQHPAVLKAVLHKGVHYFDENYGRGLNWYRAHFPLEATARRVYAEIGVRAQTFESSPYYMVHPLAPTRIAADLPGVKLLVLLRDPVERAYSAYAHELARGFETESFERALALEPERLLGQSERLASDPRARSREHQHNAYVTRGQYVDHLEVLADVFGRERIHVVDSQAFFEQPEDSYGHVLEFLGLPHLGRPRFEQHNARPRSPLPDPLRRKLEAHFEPYDQRLSEWLSARPSWRS